MEIIYIDGKTEKAIDYSLSKAKSHAVFNRDKRIDKIIVHLKKL